MVALDQSDHPTEITNQPTGTYKLSGYQLSTLLPMPMAEVPIILATYMHTYLGSSG